MSYKPGSYRLEHVVMVGLNRIRKRYIVSICLNDEISTLTSAVTSLLTVVELGSMWIERLDRCIGLINRRLKGLFITTTTSSSSGP